MIGRLHKQGIPGVRHFGEHLLSALGSERVRNLIGFPPAGINSNFVPFSMDADDA